MSRDYPLLTSISRVTQCLVITAVVAAADAASSDDVVENSQLKLPLPQELNDGPCIASPCLPSLQQARSNKLTDGLLAD